MTSLGLLQDTNVIVDKAGDSSPIDVIMHVLNITEDETWDCHINHYRDYFWEELELYNLSHYFEALGWNQARWENEDPPDSEDMDWFELSADETTAAKGQCFVFRRHYAAKVLPHRTILACVLPEAICFFPELWAGDVEIGEWTYHPPQIQLESFNHNQTDADRVFISAWDLPAVRFVRWIDLTVVQRTYASVLGYNSR